jgi:hypothetical protein
MGEMKRTLFLLVMLSFMLCTGHMACAQAVKITVSGGWTDRIIGPLDLQGGADGAGTDLNSTYDSATNVTMIDVRGPAQQNWVINVRRADSAWNSRFVLFLKRTSVNTGVTGAETYTAVGTGGVDLIYGHGDVGGILCQYRLSGMTVAVPPGAYNSSLIFTVRRI